MYVYKPGAGFSGIAKKVEPGDDFNAIWSNEVSIGESQFVDSGISSTATSLSSDVHSDYETTQFVDSQPKSKRYLLSFCQVW